MYTYIYRLCIESRSRAFARGFAALAMTVTLFGPCVSQRGRERERERETEGQREGERERERERFTERNICIYIYIYTDTFIHIYTFVNVNINIYICRESATPNRTPHRRRSRAFAPGFAALAMTALLLEWRFWR
jgi:hypothetical protein